MDEAKKVWKGFEFLGIFRGKVDIEKASTKEHL